MSSELQKRKGQLGARGLAVFINAGALMFVAIYAVLTPVWESQITAVLHCGSILISIYLTVMSAAQYGIAKHHYMMAAAVADRNGSK